MNISDFSTIEPYVRMVKIKKSFTLKGTWNDLDHVLIYIANGSVAYNIEGISYPLVDGDALLIPPYMKHTLVHAGNEELIQYIVHFDFYRDDARKKIPHQSAYSMSEPPVLPPRETLLGKSPIIVKIPSEERPSYERMFLQIYTEFSQKRLGFDCVTRGIAIQMIFAILRCMQEGTVSNKAREEISSKPQKLAEKALEYIWLHYGDNINNAVVAEAIGISPNYLARIFQKYTGLTLHKYITNYRLEKAKHMLAEGQYNISEIAQCCGFSSIYVFSKLFKQEYAINPSSYMGAPSQSVKLEAEVSDYNVDKQIYYNQ